MHMRHTLTIGFVLSLALGMSGCASSPSVSESTPETGGSASVADRAAADSTLPVSVTHNRSDGGITTLYIEPAAGVRGTLGTIEPGSTRTFSYRIQSATRQVKLIALNSMGQTLESESVTVPRGAGLSWDLQVNAVRIRR